MICSVCGTDNQKGTKFCIKCRNNLENPSKGNGEQAEPDNCRSEEELSDRSIYQKPVVSAPKLKPPPIKLPPQNMVKLSSSTAAAQRPSDPRREGSPKKEKLSGIQTLYDSKNTAANRGKKEADLFGKAKAEQPVSNDPFADIDNRRKQRLREKAGPAVMRDMPIVDASKLEKYDEGKYKDYMKDTGDSRSDDLLSGTEKQRKCQMAETNIVDADDIEAYVPEHKEALMAQAMPKKTAPCEKEPDKTEQTEYMDAQKNVREGRIKIHSILKFKK